MHGKGVVVDNDWAMVGSTNLDKTSFHDNYEANVRIHDKKFVRKLKITLLRWVNEGKSINKKKWKKRGQWHRLKEWMSVSLLNFWHRKIKD